MAREPTRKTLHTTVHKMFRATFGPWTAVFTCSTMKLELRPRRRWFCGRFARGAVRQPGPLDFSPAYPMWLEPGDVVPFQELVADPRT